MKSNKLKLTISLSIPEAESYFKYSNTSSEFAFWINKLLNLEFSDAIGLLKFSSFDVNRFSWMRESSLIPKVSFKSNKKNGTLLSDDSFGLTLYLYSCNSSKWYSIYHFGWVWIKSSNSCDCNNGLNSQSISSSSIYSSLSTFISS